MIRTKSTGWISLSFLVASVLATAAATPVVSNVRASQRAGTKLVDIHYDVADADGHQQTVQVYVSGDGGRTFRIPAVTISGNVGAGVSVGANRHIVWDAGVDGSKANSSGSGDPFELNGSIYTTPCGYYNGSQTPAGGDMANGYGLYDMAGNAWEWCWDWYGSTYYGLPEATDNPKGPSSGNYRMLRGGAWGNDPVQLAVREPLLQRSGRRRQQLRVPLCEGDSGLAV